MSSPASSSGMLVKASWPVVVPRRLHKDTVTQRAVSLKELDGQSIRAVNLPGTSDKDFSSRVLTAAVPVSRRAGANTIQLSNPGTPQAGASSAFIDRIQI